MKKNTTLRLVTMAMLVAIAVILLLMIRIPLFAAAPYLRYDMADVPILIGTMLFGPGAGVAILAVVSFIQAFLLGEDGWIGFLMHVLSSGALVLVAGLIYHRVKTTKRMVVGLLLGSLAMTALMIPLNLIITVHLYGVPREVVLAGLLPVTIPFNLIKSGANSVITFLVFHAIQPVVAKIRK